MESNKEQVVDSIVESVINKIRTRSEIGIAKYGITLDRTDYSTIDWIDAAIEEQMDNILYLTRLKQDIRAMEEKMSDMKKEVADTKAHSIKYHRVGTGVDIYSGSTKDKPKPNYLKYGWHY
jgi:histidinol dehydrogenase